MAAAADVPAMWWRHRLSVVDDRLAVVLLEENEPPTLHYCLALCGESDGTWRILGYVGGFGLGAKDAWFARPFGSDATPMIEDADVTLGVGVRLRALRADEESARIVIAPSQAPLTVAVRGHLVLMAWWSIDADQFEREPIPPFVDSSLRLRGVD